MGIVANQPLEFLICCAIGCALGFLYAILAPMRRRAHKVIAILLDLLFWSVACVGVLAGLYMATSGVIRAFCLLGMAVGFCGMLWGPGQILIRWETKLLVAVAKQRKALAAKLMANRKENDCE